MRKTLTVAVLSSAFLLAAAPAQASTDPIQVNLDPLLNNVLELLFPTPEEAPPPEPEPVYPSVDSTAYCLTGTMASGKKVYEGAAAMNDVPLGSRYRVLDGPRAGEIFIIEDRIGHSSEFDIAYPGDCDAAIQYGRRLVRIQLIEDEPVPAEEAAA